MPLRPHRPRIQPAHEDGLDLLVYIGMDAIELDGKHFEAQRLLRVTPSSVATSSAEFDIPAIKALAATDNPMITNARSGCFG